MLHPPVSRILAIALSLAVFTLASAAQTLPDGKIRVLVVTGGHDFEAESFFGMFQAIPDITTETATYPAAAESLKPELADKYDVVVFYDMWAQGITEQQQKDFVALLHRGIGVVALHHTLAAHQAWPEYEKIIGGKFQLQERIVDGKTLPTSGYEHDQQVSVHIANGEHPITKGLKDFEIRDETYNKYDTDPQATVLLTTEHPKSDRELAWAKTYANSRVVYIELGHDHFAYENPNYQTLVARAIRWTAGRPTDPQAAAVKLFNGQDLTGWKPDGNATWEVEDGHLTGRQGAGNAPGDLFTEATFADFELTVTYRVVWPANSGVWYRYQSGAQAYQADILEYENPFALSGTLYRPGLPNTPFLATNTDATIIDREGWNTLVIRAFGNRHVMFLNGNKTADVCDDISDKGTIGFQVHAGDQFAKMKIIVREITIRPL